MRIMFFIFIAAVTSCKTVSNSQILSTSHIELIPITKKLLTEDDSYFIELLKNTTKPLEISVGLSYFKRSPLDPEGKLGPALVQAFEKGSIGNKRDVAYVLGIACSIYSGCKSIDSLPKKITSFLSEIGDTHLQEWFQNSLQGQSAYYGDKLSEAKDRATFRTGGNIYQSYLAKASFSQYSRNSEYLRLLNNQQISQIIASLVDDLPTSLQAKEDPLALFEALKIIRSALDLIDTDSKDASHKFLYASDFTLFKNNLFQFYWSILDDLKKNSKMSDLFDTAVAPLGTTGLNTAFRKIGGFEGDYDSWQDSMNKSRDLVGFLQFVLKTSKNAICPQDQSDEATACVKAYRDDGGSPSKMHLAGLKFKNLGEASKADLVRNRDLIFILQTQLQTILGEINFGSCRSDRDGDPLLMSCPAAHQYLDILNDKLATAFGGTDSFASGNENGLLLSLMASQNSVLNFRKNKAALQEFAQAFSNNLTADKLYPGDSESFIHPYLCQGYKNLSDTDKENTKMIAKVFARTIFAAIRTYQIYGVLGPVVSDKAGYAVFQDKISRPIVSVRCSGLSGLEVFSFDELKTEISRLIGRWTTRAEEELYLFGTAEDIASKFIIESRTLK